jgi:hypothetical protein
MWVGEKTQASQFMQSILMVPILENKEHKLNLSFSQCKHFQKSRALVGELKTSES